MVLEQAVLHVIPGREKEFEVAFAGVVGLLRGASGCRSVRLHRGIETPSRYLLLVQWDSLEAHVEGFRTSPEYPRYRQPLNPLYESAPEVEHFELSLEG